MVHAKCLMNMSNCFIVLLKYSIIVHDPLYYKGVTTPCIFDGVILVSQLGPSLDVVFCCTTLICHHGCVPTHGHIIHTNHSSIYLYIHIPSKLKWIKMNQDHNYVNYIFHMNKLLSINLKSNHLIGVICIT